MVTRKFNLIFFFSSYLSPVRGQRTRGTSQENVTSPAKSTQSAAGNQSKDSSQPKPVNSSKRSHSLNMFFNKGT
jgi:hypothetical protein